MAVTTDAPRKTATTVEQSPVGIHWITPTSMAAALLTGCAFAIGHHAFYSRFEGKPVSNEIHTLVGLEFSDQQRNIAIGNVFALLVRSFLVLAVGIAYAQLLWFSVVRQSSELATLDVQYSSLSNLLSIGNLAVWWKTPLLFLVALLAWLLPLASVLTPATLSVGIALPYFDEVPIMQVDYKSLKLLANMGISEQGRTFVPNPVYQYNGPSDFLQRVASASLSEDNILPLNAPKPNSSWPLSFEGPAIRCRAVDNSTYTSNLKDNIVNYVLGQYVDGDAGNRNWGYHCTNAPAFIAWTGLVESYSQEITPPYSPAGNTSIFKSTRSREDESFFIASIPAVAEYGYDNLKACNLTLFARNATFEQQRDYLFSPLNSANPREPVVVQCDLHAAAYTTEFRFLNGDQNVNVTVSNYSTDPIPAGRVIAPEGDTGSTSGSEDIKICQFPASMQMQNKVVPCQFNTTDLSHLSYRAVFDAFSSLLTRSIGMELGNGGVRPAIEGSFTGFGISQAKELGFLSNMSLLEYGQSGSGASFLAQGPGNEASMMYPGLMNTVPLAMTIPIQDLLEQKFVNLTMSLMSSPHLQPEEASPFYPPLTNVTFSMSDNIYVYSQAKLWLAYGIAIATSLVAVIAGLIAMWLNGAAYSFCFSTFLRISRGAHVDAEIQPCDMDGRDPLPKYLRTATVSFPDGHLEYSSLPLPSEHSSLT